MNFTREPIIETILSPKDGYKLCVKNSKITDSEEMFVDVVEVVSFGHAFFFRGQERPKPFLVPISDYEIFEVKETRVVLKNVSHDRNIKIGGGREAFVKPLKEQPVSLIEDEPKEVELVASVPAEAASDGKNDRKRDRRRNRRRRLAEERRDTGDKDKQEVDPDEEDSIESEAVEVVKTPSPMFAQLLPPPTVLISERLGQLKEKERERELAEASAAVLSKELEGDPSVCVVEEITKEDEFFS